MSGSGLASETDASLDPRQRRGLPGHRRRSLRNCPTGQAIRRADFDGSCLNTRLALIANAQSIAASLSNKLSADTRTDLTRYAGHLSQSEEANLHRLSFLAKGIRADLEVLLVNAGYSNRICDQLHDFLSLHQSFLDDCVPEADAAIRTRDATDPARPVTREETTALLTSLQNAVAIAEAATASVTAMINDMRAYDAKLHAFKIKVFSDADQQELVAAVTREVVETGTVVARLFWCAR